MTTAINLFQTSPSELLGEFFAHKIFVICGPTNLLALVFASDSYIGKKEVLKVFVNSILDDTRERSRNSGLFEEAL